MEEFNVLLHHQVYNIARFMKMHPGGSNLLRGSRNKDIGHQMEKYGHNEHAYHLLEGYRVTDGNANGIGVNNNGVKGKGIYGKPGIDVTERLKEIQKIEDLIDWSKPMLPQLKNLGDDYNIWIDCPVDKKVRIFESQSLENLTHSPWYVVFVYWVLIATYMVRYTYLKHVACGDACKEEETISTLVYVALLFFGVGLWTAIEYALHRFIFHAKPKGSILYRKIHFLYHGLHHKTPFDKDRQVFPPVPATVATIVIYFLLCIIFGNMTLVITTGAIIGYLTYDMIHYYIHEGSPKDGTYLYAMKRYHANHHFINPHIGFGISNRIWDVVFNTKINIKSLGFSLSWE